MPARTVLITFDDGYADNWICAYPLLKRYGFTASVFVTTGRVINAPARKTISEGGQPPPFTGQHAGAFLSWEELRRMAESGVFEIGSHTRTHNDFNKHKSWPDMPAELVDSANEIFEKTGNRPDTLSWPWGYSTPELAKCALDVGYKMAFAAKPGSNTPRTDKFFVRRFTVRMGDVNWLARRLWLYSHPLLASAYGSMYRIV
ncbi:MAG: polysaccharide deacetylase family protein [Elusimicrobiales bacterium]